jgi:hypothetical protein
MREDDPPSDDDTHSLLIPHVDNHQSERTEPFLPAPRSAEPTEYDLEIEEELAYSAAHVTSILKPVSITMLLVVLIVKATSEQLGGVVVQSPYLVYRRVAMLSFMFSFHDSVTFVVAKLTERSIQMILVQELSKLWSMHSS